MTPELVNQITILNRNIDAFTQKSQELIDVVKHIHGLDINTFITALAGLLGVIVGAFISYYFSKKISDSSSKARFAIQRKNLIYSKIYKELLFLKQQLDALPADMFYFEVQTNLYEHPDGRNSSSYYIDNKSYPAPEVYAWGEMKNDIRITQVSKLVVEKMSLLEEALVKYLTSVHLFSEEVERNRRTFSHHAVMDDTCFFVNPLTKDGLMKSLSRPWGSVKNEEREASLLKVIDATLDKPYLDEARQNFVLLKEAVDDANRTLEKLIREVVAKYEYGEEI